MKSAAVLTATLVLVACSQAAGTGPKGDRGLTGAQGPKGDTGPQGPKGDTGPAGSAPTINANYVTSTTSQVGLTQNSFTIIPYSVSTYDTSTPALFSAGTSSYSIPVAGLYLITASVATAPHAFAAGDYLELGVSIGDTNPNPILGLAYSPGGNETLFVQGSVQVKFGAGQSFTIKALTNATGVEAATATNTNYLSIARIAD